MSEVVTRRLEPEDAESFLRVLRSVWLSTYIEPGLLDESELEKRFPQTDEAVDILAKKLKRQYDPADNTKPRYVGVFPENKFLAGYLKTAKPMKELNRRDGNETLRQKISRNLTGKPPELQAATLSEILEIGVMEELQGQGLGRALMLTAVEELPSEVSTVAAFSRQDIMPFFEQYGFVPTGQALFYPVHDDPSGIEVKGMHAAVDDLRARLTA